MRPRNVRVPPGRAGLIWLRRRVAAAERGADQLDRRLRVLRPELERRTTAATVCRKQWAAEAATAELWTARASVLGGATDSAGGGDPSIVHRHADERRESVTGRRAEVRLTWESTAGVRLPGPATVVPVEDSDVPAANAAVPQARAAQRAALVAAVDCAVAEEGVRRLEGEVLRTRRRLRAIERVWLPWLQEALAVRQLELDQAAQEDVARVRRALTAEAGTRDLRP